MSAREFAEWRALNQIDPIDAEYRADVRAAMLAAHLANITVGKNKKTGKAWLLSDFMLNHDQDGAPAASRDKTPEQMLAFAAAITQRLGGALPAPADAPAEV